MTNKCWLEAGQLNVNESVLTSEETYEKIINIGIETLEEDIPIYNLEVKDYHTFYVGEEGVLVHNEYNMPNLDDIYKSYISEISDENLKVSFKEQLKRISESNDIELLREFDSKLQNISSGDTKALKELLDNSQINNGSGNFKKITTTKIDNVIASGFDETGNLVKRWVVPKGFNSVDDFLKTVNNITIKNYGYKSIDEFKEVVENTDKYLNLSSKNTILNQSLAGGIHANGLKYDILGFPIFEGKSLVFEHDLPKNLLKNVTDIEQFENCTMALHDAIKNGELPECLFTSTQLRQIIDGKPRIKGLTWHHHQVTGKMQLVNAQIHQANHLGGNSIWGGGIR